MYERLDTNTERRRKDLNRYRGKKGSKRNMFEYKNVDMNKSIV